MRQIWRAITAWFYGPHVDGPPPIGHNLPPKEDTDLIHATGRWRYLRDILNQLDDYFYFIRRMKQADPDAYDLYSRVGGVIVSTDVAQGVHELPAAWRAGVRQAFGCILSSMSVTEDDTIFPTFMYFWKIRLKEGVEAFHGDTYECVMLFTERKNKKFIAPFHFYVGVNDAAEIKLLKVKYRAAYGQMRWGYPRGLLGIFNDRKSPKIKTIQEYAAFIFSWCVNVHDSATSDIRVSARRGDIVAAFSVDLLRTPYFFKHRDFVPASDGRQKRIFHIVRTHARETRNGRQYVKSHFRGVRKFSWNGYQINITMPGKHHADLRSFTATALQGFRKRKGHLFADEAGDMIGKELAA
jgi:hypothetical protein